MVCCVAGRCVLLACVSCCIFGVTAHAFAGICCRIKLFVCCCQTFSFLFAFVTFVRNCCVYDTNIASVRAGYVFARICRGSVSVSVSIGVSVSVRIGTFFCYALFGLFVLLVTFCTVTSVLLFVVNFCCCITFSFAEVTGKFGFICRADCSFFTFDNITEIFRTFNFFLLLVFDCYAGASIITLLLISFSNFFRSDDNSCIDTKFDFLAGSNSAVIHAVLESSCRDIAVCSAHTNRAGFDHVDHVVCAKNISHFVDVSNCRTEISDFTAFNFCQISFGKNNLSFYAVSDSSRILINQSLVNRIGNDCHGAIGKFCSHKIGACIEGNIRISFIIERSFEHVS